MKKFSQLGLVIVVIVLLALASCSKGYGAAPAMTEAPVNSLPMFSRSTTETATAPVEADTVTPPPPTDSGCTSTNIINVPLLSGNCIRVTTNNPQLKNTVGQALTCKVVGPSQTTTITVNPNSTAGFDTTASGSYTLSCTGSPLSVKIEK